MTNKALKDLFEKCARNDSKNPDYLYVPVETVEKLVREFGLEWVKEWLAGK